jgi:hypothetical protein
MREINWVAVIVAAIAAFVLSTAWYIAFAKQRAALSGVAMADMKKPQPIKMAVEIVRNIVLASIIAYLVARLGVSDWSATICFAIVLWVGFPVLLLSGSVIWENVPWKLAIIHAGDWLLKLLLMVIILSRWR